MKINFLRNTAAGCIGTILALSVAVARADAPKKDDDSTSTTTHQKHVAKAKAVTKVTEKSAPTTLPTRDGRNAQYSFGGQTGGSNGPEHAVLSGSHIPRTYNRRGYSTDTEDNAFIYDKNDIRLRSTLNVQDSLRSVPGVTVGGMR